MTSNWKECKIGDIVEIRRGASPRPIHQFISNKGMPWVKIADATSDNSRYIRKTNEFIIYDGVKHSVLVEPETLIVSNSATPGLPKIMKIQACVHDGWLVFSNYQGLLRDFLYYKFIDIQKKLLNQANGSVFQNLKTDIVKDFDILLPPLETQRKIAKVLSAIDDKIELNNSLNNNLEQQAQAIFKQIFSDISEDDLPSNWHKGTIGEIVELHDSKRVPLSGQQREKMKQKIYPYYGATSLMDYVDDYIFDGIYLLLGEDGTVIDTKGFPILQYVWGKFWVNNHAHILTGKNGFNVESLYLLFRQLSIKSIVTGAVQAKISQANLKSLEVIIPPIEVIENLNDKIKPFFYQIRSNLDENKVLTQLRDTLLPKLMSGEIDVSKVDISADKLLFSEDK